MLDFIIQGFAIIVLTGGAYYVGRNRTYFQTKYPTVFSWLPDWTRVETP
jgi:hypothetical protein